MIAVIDRFECNYAVVLIGPEETQVDFPRHLLPKGALDKKAFLMSALSWTRKAKRKEEKDQR